MDLKLDMSKLDKLTEDLKKLEAPKVVKHGKDGENAVPMFQAKGHLEKLGHKNKQWYKRFFVLRDCFLLSYNLTKSDFTVEPNKCIHLVKCKIETMAIGDHPFCFALTTAENDRFVFSATTEKELNTWRKDIEIARIISHKNMVKLAVENQCLAEAKGLTELVKSYSSSALTIFSNPEYIKKTPVTGGAEGWLQTTGFCVPAGKGKLKKSYFILKDSHLLMFHGGDVLKKPRGCMYLVGTTAKEVPGDEEGKFRFLCSSAHCADFIELVANSEAQRQRWMAALKVGARVTYGDFKLLLKEHELLTAYHPDARTALPLPGDINSPEDEPIEHQVKLDDHGIQGDELEPGTAQPYDAEGNPLLRNPDGKLVDSSGNEVSAKDERFDSQGAQLDPFNRPLPQGAVPMFTSDGQPIGVGPDGKHYLPDGTEITKSDPHFNKDGGELASEAVTAADAIAPAVEVAIKVRARMKGEGAGIEEVDVLGRTFRPKTARGDVVINADGVEVPIKTARRAVNPLGQLVATEEVTRPASEVQTGRLLIKAEDEEGESKEIGAVEIDDTTTLSDVRGLIDKEVNVDFPEFVFLVNLIAVTRSEEINYLAMACLPEVHIRGGELKKVDQSKLSFSKKSNEFSSYEDQKKREAEDFKDIMERVRQGNFLRKVRKE